MSKYGKFFLLICLIDLLITCVLIGFFPDAFWEGNSILAFWMKGRRNVVSLIAVKLSVNFMSLFLLEAAYNHRLWYRKSKLVSRKPLVSKKIISYFYIGANISYALFLIVGFLYLSFFQHYFA